MTHRVRIAALLCLCFSTPLVADDGDLDPSFWADGKMAVDATADVTFGGLASDVGGQMAVAYSYVPPVVTINVGVWRGVADASLGGECDVDPQPTHLWDTWIYDMAFDAFGRLLVLAASYDGDESYLWSVLAYAFPHCALLPSYGSGGIAAVPGQDDYGIHENVRLRPLADGTTLVVGSGKYGTAWISAARVVQLDASGTATRTLMVPDGTFSVWTGGVDVAAAPNGHLVLVAENALQLTPNDFLIADFAPDGTMVGHVAVAFDLGGEDVDLPKSIAATADGRIVVVGSAQLSGRFVMTAHAIAVLHWNAAGVLELDPSFSDDGKLTFDFDGWTWNGLESVEAQGDGKIVVAGASMPLGGDYAMAVARLLPDGSFDGDFVPSQPGWRIVDFDLVPPPAHDRAYRVALQNGRIVLAGVVALTTNVDSVGVARLLNSYVFGDGFENPQAPGWLWVD